MHLSVCSRDSGINQTKDSNKESGRAGDRKKESLPADEQKNTSLEKPSQCFCAPSFIKHRFGHCTAYCFKETMCA